MKGFRILLSVTVGIVTYLLLCIFLGRTGVFEYQKLSTYSTRLEANLADLDQIHSRLEDRVQSLQSDPQNIQVLARDLGYFSSGERILRLRGYDPDREVTSPGKMVYRNAQDTNLKPLFRVISIVVGQVTFLIMMLDGAGVREAGKNLRGQLGDVFHRPRRRHTSSRGASLGRTHGPQPT